MFNLVLLYFSFLIAQRAKRRSRIARLAVFSVFSVFSYDGFIYQNIIVNSVLLL